DAFPERWAQVRDEMERTGTYTQTTDEVAHAARVAWRNSTRCIGRLYWQGLSVRDFRHVTTEGEMFQALFEHIELATNGGNLRAVITLFPPAPPTGPGPRVWSPQFFGYAGYRLANGSVLGDPANLELTGVAVALGWTPPEPTERRRAALLRAPRREDDRSPLRQPLVQPVRGTGERRRPPCSRPVELDRPTDLRVPLHRLPHGPLGRHRPEAELLLPARSLDDG